MMGFFPKPLFEGFLRVFSLKFSSKAQTELYGKIGATDARIFAVVAGRQMMKAGSWVMEGWESTSISLSQWPTFNSAVLNDESK